MTLRVVVFTNAFRCNAPVKREELGASGWSANRVLEHPVGMSSSPLISLPLQARRHPALGGCTGVQWWSRVAGRSSAVVAVACLSLAQPPPGVPVHRFCLVPRSGVPAGHAPPRNSGIIIQ